jgi:hypothetical protein
VDPSRFMERDPFAVTSREVGTLVRPASDQIKGVFGF